MNDKKITQDDMPEGWRLLQPLNLDIERMEDNGDYLATHPVLLGYGVGKTREESALDFLVSAIETFEDITRYGVKLGPLMVQRRDNLALYFERVAVTS